MFNVSLGLSIFGLISVALIMLPNIIWAIYPPKEDILSSNATSSWLDIIENICRYAMIALFIGFVGKTDLTSNKTFLVFAIICLGIYYLLWVVYYFGNARKLVLMGLAFIPTIYFLSISLWLGNYLSIIPNVIFTVCHIIITIRNYQ